MKNIYELITFYEERLKSSLSDNDGYDKTLFGKVENEIIRIVFNIRGINICTNGCQIASEDRGADALCD